MRLIKIRPGSTIIEQGGQDNRSFGLCYNILAWRLCTVEEKHFICDIKCQRKAAGFNKRDRIRNDDIANITGTTSCIGDCCSSVSSKLDCGLDNVFKFPSKQRFLKKNLPSLKWVPGNFLKSKDDQCGIDFVTRFIY